MASWNIGRASSSLKRELCTPLFFALVMVLAFWKVIFHPDFTLLAGADMSAQTYPWFSVAAYWLKRGVLLLWDPHVYAGKATLGELQPGLLYPINWLFMLLPSEDGEVNRRGLEWLLILNHFLAGYFSFLLARAVGLRFWSASVAGIAFSLGGFAVHLRAFTNIFSSFVWLPLVFLCFWKSLQATDRISRLRWMLSSSCLIALSFLAGHHAAAVHAGLLLFMYLVFRAVTGWRDTRLIRNITNFASLALAAAVSAMLAAVQLLPSLEWGRRALRWVGSGEPFRGDEGIPYSILQQTGELNPQDTISLIFPYLTTLDNLYVGGAVLFLVLTGLLFPRQRDIAFFAIATFLFLFLSMGQFSAFHGWINTFIPGVWFAREPYLYLVPFHLCLGLVAGGGLQYLLDSYGTGAGKTLVKYVRYAGLGMAFFIIAAAITIISAHVVTQLPLDHPYISSLSNTSLYLVILGIYLFLLQKGRIQPRLFGILATALILLDVASHQSLRIQPIEQPAGRENLAIQKLWKMPPAAEYLRNRQSGAHFRVDDPEKIFPPNFGDVWRIDATMGHGATGLESYLNFRNTGWEPGSNASALLNARYYLSRDDVPWMNRVYEDADGVAIYRNERAVPRAFATSRFRSFQDEEDILDWIKTPLFAPGETVLVMAEDLNRLPHPIFEELEDEHEGIVVQALNFRMEWERREAATDNEAERRKIRQLRPPWGWGEGDLAELTVHPEEPVEDCYLIFDYYPTTAAASRVEVTLESEEETGVHTVILEGRQNGDSQPAERHQTALSLGPLESKAYRLSLMRTEECTALLDSLRVSRHPPESEPSPGRVEIIEFEPNSIRLRASVNRASFVVLSEVYYPGWEALVDGEPAPLLAGNYVLRAVAVSPGEHEILLRYRPASFRWGLVLTLITLAGVAVVFILKKRPQSEPRAREVRSL